MNKPYKDGTTLDQILRDGWSRGFAPKQTQLEADLMGHPVPISHIKQMWQLYQGDMDDYFRNDPYKENDDGWIET